MCSRMMASESSLVLRAARTSGTMQQQSASTAVQAQSSRLALFRVLEFPISSFLSRREPTCRGRPFFEGPRQEFFCLFPFSLSNGAFPRPLPHQPPCRQKKKQAFAFFSVACFFVFYTSFKEGPCGKLRRAKGFFHFPAFSPLRQAAPPGLPERQSSRGAPCASTPLPPVPCRCGKKRRTPPSRSPS